MHCEKVPSLQDCNCGANFSVVPISMRDGELVWEFEVVAGPQSFKIVPSFGTVTSFGTHWECMYLS